LGYGQASGSPAAAIIIMILTTEGLGHPQFGVKYKYSKSKKSKRDVLIE
jgi:hypothetical protein